MDVIIPTPAGRKKNAMLSQRKRATGRTLSGLTQRMDNAKNKNIIPNTLPGTKPFINQAQHSPSK